MDKGPPMVFIYLKLSLAAVFWGGTFIAGRVVARDLGPFSAAFLRFAVASILLLLLMLKVERKFPTPRKDQVLPLILLGMTGIFAYNFFFFSGLKIIEAGRASLIVANNPIVIVLLASYFFGEKLKPSKIVGIVLSITGAIVVISRGHLFEILHGNLGWGEFYIFCCVLSWAAYSLIGKAIMTGLSPLISVTYSCAIGASALFIPAYLEGMTRNFAHYTSPEWGSILYLGVFGTVVGFLWYYEGIKHIGPTRASQFINFVPISAVLLAFFILKEPITLSLGMGTLFVVSGVYLTNRASH